jgi:hypothetical protein
LAFHSYMKTPRGSRLFELGLGRLALALLAPPAGLTIEDAKRQVEWLMQHEGPTWLAAWLDQCGLGTWAEALRTEAAGPASECARAVDVANSRSLPLHGGRSFNEHNARRSNAGVDLPGSPDGTAPLA